jgi:hypothetical protein
MDASVNLRTTPQEFDLIREALRDARDVAHAATRDSERTPADRREQREREARLADLLTKLH